jgi:hypothetical protein
MCLAQWIAQAVHSKENEMKAKWILKGEIAVALLSPGVALAAHGEHLEKSGERLEHRGERREKRGEAVAERGAIAARGCRMKAAWWAILTS